MPELAAKQFETLIAEAAVSAGGVAEAARARADPIERRDSATRASIAACGGLLNGALTEATWEKARHVIDYAGPAVWMHSDLHPGNILVSDHGLSAVIDWGGLALGDPAIDCLIAWTLLTPSTRHTFRLRVDVDEDAWPRMGSGRAAQRSRHREQRST
ncbi:phosphotransferase [Rhodococcus erythropolis]|uniref:phosphotransferase n=1 Tax=Rhodococcus erythropolis TaxID=1833 RepID=UPI001E414C62|nr:MULTISPECIES: phosphotransferase [Rhodococcus erythropolis group]MCD2109284.1 phosphotransferase [Rhodococcus qingshengii]MCZ4528208.1 phosphotransferase [Rhodococcus erythropolis]